MHKKVKLSKTLIPKHPLNVSLVSCNEDILQIFLQNGRWKQYLCVWGCRRKAPI